MAEKNGLTNVKLVASILRALNHKLRQSMMELMENKPGITVTEIYAKLHLEQSVASQHLAILRQAGIVKIERDKKMIRYSLNKERIKEIDLLLQKIVAGHKSITKA
ncbi:helix-turn-helix transcriptional regulator [Candidatus Nomurabacteria bacterium]|nr:MAG: helix-turn-helix transcriptional regulator [Candidatus Nomurabacteria bacterium]